MPTKEIYLLSGLGADQRVFDFLELSNFKQIYIEWIEPLPKESIENYAQRLSAQIKTINPVLIGVSFGGMMAVEIGKLIPTEKIILISSAKTRADIPSYYKIIGFLRVHWLVPVAILKNVNALTYWFFGVSDTKEKKLLREIIKETNGKFLVWAIDQIPNWKNRDSVPNTISIHGTNDKLLPIRSSEYKVQDGGHLMIITKAEEVSKKVNEALMN